MKILFASDFHIGMTRTANHTSESSQRREQESRTVLLHALQTTHDVAVCAGDFFDKFSNPETTIIESLEFADAFNYVLAGNHDSSQRDDTRSSLDIIDVSLARCLVVKEPMNHLISSSGFADPDAVRLWFVPHALSQGLFLGALDQAQLEANAAGSGGVRILVTHCSYDLSFELSTSSLNLTRERAEQLLTAFDYVLLGHEHVAREDFDGRLIVIGSHFPTSFSDLTDKRHLIFNTDTKRMDSVVHWRAGEHVYVGPGCDAPPGLQYYDLADNSDPKLPVHLFKAGALGVRVPSSAAQQTFVHQDLPRLALAAQIRGGLAEKPELLALFDELLEGR